MVQISTTTVAGIIKETTLTLGHISSDITILATLIGIVILYIVYRGREEGIANVFALLISGFVFSLFPYWNTIAGAGSVHGGYERGIIFVVMFFVVRHICKKFIAPGYGGLHLRTVIETIFLSAGTVGLLLAYGYNYFNLKNFYVFGIPFLKSAFETPQGLFGVALFALFSLLLVRRLQGH